MGSTARSPRVRARVTPHRGQGESLVPLYTREVDSLQHETSTLHTRRVLLGWPLVPVVSQPNCLLLQSVPLYQFTFAAPSCPAWPLVPRRFADGVQVHPYTLADVPTATRGTRTRRTDVVTQGCQEQKKCRKCNVSGAARHLRNAQGVWDVCIPAGLPTGPCAVLSAPE